MGRHVLLPIFPRVLKRPCGVAIGSRKSLEKILFVPAFLLTVDPTPAERNFNSSKVGNIGFVRKALGDLEPEFLARGVILLQPVSNAPAFLNKIGLTANLSIDMRQIWFLRTVVLVPARTRYWQTPTT
jgi:hypothetical protein